MSEPRYDFTIAVSRVGDPDFREQGTIMNCPLSSLLLKNTFLQAELLNRLIDKLEHRNGNALDGKIELAGKVTVTEVEPAAAAWPPGTIQQEVA